MYIFFFSAVKNENFVGFFIYLFIFFLIFVPNIGCRYTLEPSQRDGFNEYPQPMFWSKNKEKRYIPACQIFIYMYIIQYPFQDYFSSHETGQSVGRAKTGEPREKPPDTPASLYPSFAI